jgi:predicted acetyltransferase
VTVTLRDARDSDDDRAWIRAAYRDYLSELSASRSGIIPVSGEWQSRDDEFLAGWLRDPAAQPFVILASGARSGFAVVTRLPAWPRSEADFRMSEFFVVPAARGRGVGAHAPRCCSVASRAPGKYSRTRTTARRSPSGAT